MVPFISQDFIDAKLFSFGASRRGQFLYLLTQGTDEVNDLSEGTVQKRKCRIASSHLLRALFFFLTQTVVSSSPLIRITPSLYDIKKTTQPNKNLWKTASLAGNNFSLDFFSLLVSASPILSSAVHRAKNWLESGPFFLNTTQHEAQVSILCTSSRLIQESSLRVCVFKRYCVCEESRIILSDIILHSSFLVQVTLTEPEVRSMRSVGRKRLGEEIEQLCPRLKGQRAGEENVLQ